MSPSRGIDTILDSLTPLVFRASTRILELISRHSLSIDSAFHEAMGEFRLKPGEQGAVYTLAKRTLENIGPAIYALEKYGKSGLPLRRKAAFYIAFYLAQHSPDIQKKLRAVRGGLLSDSLLGILSPRNIEQIFMEIEEQPVSFRLAYLESIPPLIVKTLLTRTELKEVKEILKSFRRRHVWVRVSDPGRVEYVREFLEQRGLRARVDVDFPYLLEVGAPSEGPLPELPLGVAVYQDKASVAAVEALLSLSPQGLVVDLAAAPCMKSSLICNRAREVELVAVDVSEKRLSFCKKIMSRAHCSSHLICADGRVFSSTRPFDAAIVDAPCTNSGAISRDPGLRLSLWGLRREDLEYLKQTQTSLLRNALRASGRRAPVLYSTCSVLPEEGEDVLGELQADFVSLRPTLPPRLERELVRPCEGCYRLYPHLHKTDGFFFAVISRAF
ncbi:RsmB/NOP family class I SAM-dependent RNA methyltransferase [Infirmifilum lucidum]|uniref:RsmB/NOP family class I SAM-dependent RNA methyltransferase n=1 Tax=Infirmifilum lucidum TaxID=2776706 RepID=A0A7L9FKV1_9CREN|nr:RsmB/NOP family class I SAM-dependent RNA methyltransferase [Infirmifilum lucidum]QOJ79574.1 RsmB/NOP family class I SAM-dependent RNA methyltransferase [Infirmifilum lucidum]